MAIAVSMSQKQTAGMSPEHMLGKSVLKMNLLELQECVQAEFCENPALVVEEQRDCPVCGSVLVEGSCSICGARNASEAEMGSGQTDEWEEHWWKVAEDHDDPYPEPFARIASPTLLGDYLKEQIRMQFHPEDIETAEFIVDCLDNDGYLREPLHDIAVRFGHSVPELEVVLKQVQSLDPAGVGARSIQECLLIQLRQIEDDSDDKSNAELIITDFWNNLSKMKLDEISKMTGLTKEEIKSALAFVRKALNPYPACAFHDPWQKLAPLGASKMIPDAVIHNTELGLVAEVVDPISGKATIEQTYQNLYSAMSQKRNSFSEYEVTHVREQVLKAKSLIDALEFRKDTLRKVVEEIMIFQADFIAKGPSALKPITRKELAARIGVHESTVCRATQNKSMRLPNGEVISFDVIFDSALPVKERVRELAVRHLTDGEIAEELCKAGIQIARRTVAKYRDQLRVLPCEYRMA